MQYRRFTISPCGLAFIAVALCLPTHLPAAQEAEEIPRLIESLADGDPSIRDDAEKRLAELGPAAQASLEQAAQSDDPERATRAEQLLLRLPWSSPDDPPDVRKILAGYGRADLVKRFAALTQLIDRNAIDPSLRILLREPNESLRWSLAGKILERGDAATMARVREWNAGIAPGDDMPGAPAVALLAWAWSKESPERATELNRTVLELEAAHPTVDATGFLDSIYESQILLAMQTAKYDPAAELLRMLIARAGSQLAGSAAVARLFALHAYFGPLPQFDSDIRLYGPAVRRPRGADAFVALCSMLGVATPQGSALGGHLLCDLAPLERFASSEALVRANLLEPAASELRALLVTPMEDEFVRISLTLYASQRLAYIDGNAGRDREAAEHLERMIAIEKSSGYGLRGGEELEAQASWRRLRAARTENNSAEVEDQLKRLIQLPPSHADIALDVVPILRARGREKEAETFFDRAYRQMKLRADQDKGNAEAANDLAWLCARSGMHLDEALALATRAITLAPDSPAYLDTAAEANFALGKIDEAIDLETRALKLRPNDKFMMEQLERFKAGAR